MKLKSGNGIEARRFLAMLASLWPRQREEIMALADSKLGLDVEVKPIRAKHTDPQRGYYWRSLHFWGDCLGYTAKEAETLLHMAVCCEAFGVKETRRMGNNVVEIPNHTSSRLHRDDYSLLIDRMLYLAGQSGVNVPPPERVA